MAFVHRWELNTLPLAVWVRYMFSQLWITFVREPSWLPGPWVERCKIWGHFVGVLLMPAFLQLGVVRGDTSSLL